jgi:hypothetical protein
MDGMMVALEFEFDQSFGDRRHTSAPRVSQHASVHDSSWVMEAPIYSDGQMGGTLRVNGDVAEARCQTCGCITYLLILTRCRLGRRHLLLRPAMKPWSPVVDNIREILTQAHARQ